MKRSKFVYLAAAVVAVAAVFVLAGPAGASRQVHATTATNVHCGDTINASITMNGDLDCSGSTGITIDTSGITFNLGGHTLTGPSSGNGDVIYAGACEANGCNNVTVTNGTVDGGYEQVDFFGSNDTASSLTLKNARYDSVYLDYTTGAAIVDNTITGAADYGVLDDEYGAGDLIQGNVLKGNGLGVYVEDSQYETITGNVANTSTGNDFEDEDSDYDVWYGNVSTYAGTYGFEIYEDGYGSVTFANNTARLAQGDYGIYSYASFSSPSEEWYGVTPPYSTFSGNHANYNVGDGFYSEYDYLTTYSNNTASRNGGYGFNWDYPYRTTISGNSATQNGDDGMYIEDNYADGPYDVSSFTNNSSTYNAGYGFIADYGLAGSGNTGGGTNTSPDCYAVSGCS